MTLKKLKLINIVVIFLLSFLAHNLYEWVPNTFTSIFFPVNESIFEHMKIIATCFLFYGFFEFFLLQFLHISFSNYLFSLIVCIISGILFYLLLFLPIYFFISRSMIITIGLLFITYIFMNIVSYFILSFQPIVHVEKASIVLIIALYTLFGYLTYCPPHCYLFFDTAEEKYGINEYLL